MGLIHGLFAKLMYPTPDEGTFVEELTADEYSIPDNDDTKAANQRPPEPGKNQMPDPNKPKPRPRRRK